ncbi:MAG: hypothetical protein ACI9FJ_001253 [Alteromonadaceae bacterium]
MTYQVDSRVCVFEAENAIEANVIKGLLTGEGIDVLLKGEHLSGAMGELPPTDLTIGVWIYQIKLAAATPLIDDYVRCQKSTADSTSDWICTGCGESNSANFEICWQCQRDSDE